MKIARLNYSQEEAEKDLQRLIEEREARGDTIINSYIDKRGIMFNAVVDIKRG